MVLALLAQEVKTTQIIIYQRTLGSTMSARKKSRVSSSEAASVPAAPLSESTTDSSDSVVALESSLQKAIETRATLLQCVFALEAGVNIHHAIPSASSPASSDVINKPNLFQSFLLLTLFFSSSVV
jgi:hypothetical protein